MTHELLPTNGVSGRRGDQRWVDRASKGLAVLVMARLSRDEQAKEMAAATLRTRLQTVRLFDWSSQIRALAGCTQVLARVGPHNRHR